jgi:hypothetical protein
MCSGQQDVAQRSPEFIPLSGWRQNKFWTPKVGNMFLTTTKSIEYGVIIA